MRAVLAFACLIAATALPAAHAAPAAPQAEGALIAWNAQKDGAARAYRVGDLSLSVAVGRGDQGTTYPRLTLRDRKAGRIVLRGEVGSSRMTAADFGVFRLDRAAGRPQVLLRSFSYGAHCCFRYKLAEPTARGWVVHDLGAWDGATAPEPKDLDHDGRLELAGRDERFLYAVDSYAGSVAPPLIQVVTAGKLEDVSHQAAFRPLFEAEAARWKDDCAKAQRGACLAYAASLARLGRADEAWAMISRLDAQLRPEGGLGPCGDGVSVCLGNDRVARFASVRDTFEWLLVEWGYLQRTAATPRPVVS